MKFSLFLRNSDINSLKVICSSHALRAWPSGAMQQLGVMALISNLALGCGGDEDR